MSDAGPSTWLERHQVWLSLAALLLGGLLGILAPAVAYPAEAVIAPALMLLLTATFVGVPFARIGAALRDLRFLGVVLAVNFVAAPVVAWVVTRLVSHDTTLLVGALFVLLTPCIDYVIVFTGLAGGAKDRLLAVAPVLLIAQMLLLSLFLRLFVGPEAADTVEPAPFLDALLWFIVVPLCAAAMIQVLAARTRVGAAASRGLSAGMVPFMLVTLAAVAASQSSGIEAAWSNLALLIPVYLAFGLVMWGVGALSGRAAGLDRPGWIAVAFSGATRNSLVVLPLVLALPGAAGLAALAVVTQTIVELLILPLLVRIGRVLTAT
ncbi:arsenic resistance protein [Leucobacter chromiireducens]|uniref:arsenic resistance protein n=1 Tax=Leucobacter chromiireducens TaxID=283877 RepID=UPI003F803270